ncbi:MAG: hypothetical protein LC664_08455, partial [Flavobacteriales bacterium]|nr:hypothetical protein [Flavobacteriales bacterium]
MERSDNEVKFFRVEKGVSRCFRDDHLQRVSIFLWRLSCWASGFQALGFKLQALGFGLEASGFRLSATGFRLP